MKRLIFLLTITSVLLTTFSFSSNRKQVKRGKDGQSVYISIRMADAKPADTFSLFLYKNILTAASNRFLSSSKHCAIKGKDGLFHFRINNITRPGYITICKDRDTLLAAHKLIPILNLYLIEPGDSINVNIVWDSSYHAEKHLIPFVLDYKKMIAPEIVRFPAEKYIFQYKIHFTGRGSAKYNCRYQIDRTDEASKINVNRYILSTYKRRMSSLSYDVLKADIIGSYEKMLYGFRYLKKGNIMRTIADNYFNHLPDNKDISCQAKYTSRYYANGLLFGQYFKYPKHSYANIFHSIRDNYEGRLRDKIITIFVTENNVGDSILRDAMHVVSTPYCRRQIDAIFNSQATGKIAFNFVLPDTSGKLVSLSDFRGKVIFLDFWFTGCHACSGFYKTTVSNIEDKYKGNSNVEFITISIDTRKTTWLKSIYSGLYTSPSVINLYTGGSGTSRPVIIDYHITGYPQPYIIDREGKIVATGMRSGDKIERIIKETLATK